MNRLLSITTDVDIFPVYQNTPIGLLLKYHNLGLAYHAYDHAQLLVGMCMDHRKRLRIPENFAYIIRTGGANLRYSEFKVSYAIAVGGVKSIALIGHNNCGMVNINSKKDVFIQGLVENAGWEKRRAEAHFMQFAPIFEIGNAVEFVLEETIRLRARYLQIQVAPLFYDVGNDQLYQIKEN